jgi:hypothetical protein
MMEVVLSGYINEFVFRFEGLSLDAISNSPQIRGSDSFHGCYINFEVYDLYVIGTNAVCPKSFPRQE